MGKPWEEVILSWYLTCLNCRYNKLALSFILVSLAVCDVRISWILEVQWHQWCAVPWNWNLKKRIVWKNPTQNLLPLYLVEEVEALSFLGGLTEPWLRLFPFLSQYGGPRATCLRNSVAKLESHHKFRVTEDFLFERFLWLIFFHLGHIF